MNQVMSVSIKRDRATGKNLGYGFVKLSSHQEARAAKEAMQVMFVGDVCFFEGFVAEEKRIGLVRSQKLMKNHVFFRSEAGPGRLPTTRIHLLSSVLFCYGIVSLPPIYFLVVKRCSSPPPFVFPHWRY